MLKSIINWFKNLFSENSNEEQEKIERFKKYFLSIVVSEPDSKIIEKELDGMPLKIFAQGCALGIPVGSTMFAIGARNKEKDEIPYLVYFVVVEPEEKDPNKIINDVIKKLSGALGYRWYYGKEMKFD